MKNQPSLLRWAGVLSLALVVFVVSGHFARAGTEGTGDKAGKRADVIMIDAMAAQGKLEMPPAVFLHDQHTKALAALQKDCSSCHKPVTTGDKTSYSFSYQDSATLQGEDLKKFYHTSCIGCHAELAGKAERTGPLEGACRSCHTPRPDVTADRQDIGFDKVLHYKHIASSQIIFPQDAKQNCGSCHHIYDATAKKLVWGKEKEDSCRACHMLPQEQAAAFAAAENAAEGSSAALRDENGLLAKRPTLDIAAHQSCINCHLQIAALKRPDIASGPTECAGCHSTAALDQLNAEGAGNAAVAASIPRLERGQPDAVLMTAAPGTSKDLVSSMRPVSFNHKFHESVTADCRTCHHQKITSCSSCHSLEGKAEGKFVPQSQAMHSLASKRSCVGCHRQETQKPDCAGCHASPPTSLSQVSCANCHATPVGISEQDAENASLLKLEKKAATALAEKTVEQRASRSLSTFDLADIPEKVTIGVLSKDYEPSVLPHRKIVATLLEKQKNNRLAAAFHADKATLCQGCHHNSPASLTPPKCVSCHGVSITTATNGRLPLAAAYHQQCMTCHARMDQKPAQDDCAGCHKPRGK